MSDKAFQQPSVMTSQEHFANAPSADIERSRFDRSHGLKTTFDAGLLIPIYLDEVLPGDTFTMKTTAFARLATPLKPIMDNLFLDIHYFFVPKRLTWDNWAKFMGERVNPDDDPSNYSIPQIQLNMSTTAPAQADLDLVHYFGLPYIEAAGGSGTLSVSALPFRAYNLIFNEWYRDQNLQDSIDVSLGDGPNDPGNLNTDLLRRNKRHDYFTSCLPWPQKGDPVVLPMGDTAPVTNSTVGNHTIETDGSGGFEEAVSGDPIVLEAQLTEATTITINSLREAVQMQAFLEADARGGTRLTEIILQHFRVRSSDARLQRPEFLGGGTSRVNINPIAATATDSSIPQGNLAGVGTTVGNASFQKGFEEHGFIIGIASVRADLTYQRGVERMWTRQTRYEFYWPEFAHLGEQAVLNKELWYSGTSTDDDVFGYQERYAEYRYKPSRITGLFNSDAAASLDPWHLAQDFDTQPSLNETFIQENPPIDRVIAVPAEPHFLMDVWFNLQCDRPMPVYSVPGLGATL